MALPGLNIIYADKDNNIMYIDNGQFPKKNKQFDWWHVVPGNTSATLWKANDYYPYDSLAKVINPKCESRYRRGNPYSKKPKPNTV